jgi:cyclic pyranopterin phosphate synthase
MSSLRRALLESRLRSALPISSLEMEVLVAASTAALTVYDMLKGIDCGMTIEVALQEKTGGASGTWKRGE